ncbi:MAG: vitamin B12-dependent ribonucleotide reductase [Dehalococcoidia bacterium]|nr:vitamin B12-dependent ribonucleotide reductase [Dehalococcoidia bacterium]
MTLALTPRPSVTGSWTDSAMKVLRERYLLRDGDTVLETPEDMCWRVARAIAEAEALHGASDAQIIAVAEQFYRLMVSGVFLPNSPTLMNAGKGNHLQYSACYVLPVDDSIEAIFDTVKRAALIHKSGGGTGFSFSRLRSKDSLVASTGGKASGPVSFLRVFNAATEAVKQGGTRRGANMGILRVDHPDILEFIDCKRDGGITNFNISVAITDAFMAALEAGADYPLVDPHTGAVVGTLAASMVFDRLVDAAWATGDPGVVFLDRINASRANPTPQVWAIEATNPCGEQPLAPNEACNLGSLNVGAFVRRDRPVWGLDPAQAIDWGALETAARLAIRFLDDVIDVNPYPLPEIDAAVKANRRVGLGVMGWADLLLRLGLPYGSAAAVALGERVMGAVTRAAVAATEELAAERGAFGNFERSIYAGGKARRNSTVTTIAPTGTISLLADCSSGIEPVFALGYRHQAPGANRTLVVVNRVARETLEALGWWTAEVEEAIGAHGTLAGVTGLPEELKAVFATAHEIAPSWHVRMQAAFQRETENAVSKTINLPHEAGREEVASAYRLAYRLGCLGITVFRDGCKGAGAQVLHAGSGTSATSGATGAGESAPGSVGASEATGAVAREGRSVGARGSGMRPRPVVVRGYTRQLVAPEGKVNVTLNSDEEGLLEVFVNVGKAGSDIAALAEAVGRLVSLVLRAPGPLSPAARAREIVEQLRGIGGSRAVGLGVGQLRSLPDAVARALELHLMELEEGVAPVAEARAVAMAGVNGHGESRGGLGRRVSGDLCPECGCAAVAMTEGCQKCMVCGFSQC